MRTVKLAGIGVAVVGLVLAGGAATSASKAPMVHPGLAGPLMGHQVQHQVTVTNLKLKKNLIASGFNGNALLVGDFTPIDAGSTMVCPATGTCTYEGDMTVQALGSGSANAWAICLKVDSTFASCPFIGYLDDQTFDSATMTAAVGGVAPGSHTVRTYVYSVSGGTAYNYSITYHLYKP